MSKIELNIFTCCDDSYIDFVPLFIVSNLYHIKDCFVEIGIKTDDEYVIKNTTSLINEIYPNKFLIRKLDNKIKCANETLRFINEPVIDSSYVYISDIDIITLQTDIVKIHLDIMEKHSLPYSNMVRNDSNRLTGLHFTPYDNYYPIEKYDDLVKLLQHDEVFLYHLMNKRFPTITNTNKIRPVHGIHMSPNRDPHSEKVGWELKYEWKKQAWLKFVNSDVFKFIEPHLSDRIKKCISIINDTYKNWSK